MSISFSAGAVRAVMSLLLLFAGSRQSRADDLAVSGVRMDAQNRLEVTVRMPEGFRHAVLEMQTGPPAAAWRLMVAGLMDGRAGTATFRLPRPSGSPSALARVRAGAAVTAPVVELSDPALFSIVYDGGGSTISEEVKLENLAALMRKHHEWRDLPASQRNANLVAHALTLPRVSGSGFSTLAGTVYIKYPDGDTSVIIDNRGGTSAPAGLAAAPPPAKQPAAAGRAPRGGSPPRRLPQSIDAICAYGLENDTFPDSTPQVAAWLSAAGYSVRLHSSLTVDDILSWGGRNFGVVFWQSHAGSLGADDGNQYMCIPTGQVATKELSQGRYAAMRYSSPQELLLAARPDTANPANTAGIPIYAITPAFITRRLGGMMAPNSVLALDACTGAHPDLANLFLAAGAGVHVSWNAPSGTVSGTPFRRMFDRLLGRNAEAPFSTPKERSFPMRVVQDWMQNRHFDIDPSPPTPQQPVSAQLIWRYHPAAPAYALLPSIFRVLHEARDNTYNFTKFLVEGDVGEDPGQGQRAVSWGDAAVQVLDWHETDGIRIKPPGPPYPTGDIQVIIGNRYSNRIPMTEWTIPFTYTLTGRGTLQNRIVFNAKFRTDVHRFRFEPEETPRSSGNAFWQLADCDGTVSASGLYRPNPDTTVTWSGGGALVSEDPVTGSHPGLILFQGDVNIAGSFENFLPSVTGTYTVTRNGTASNGGAVLDGFYLPQSLSFNPATFTVTPGERPAPFPVQTQYGLSASLSWSTATPVAPPTADTPR